MTPELLREVALEIATSRTLQESLDVVVTRLAAADDIALARIWLIEEADQKEGEASAPTGSLRLRASDGESLDPKEERWNRLNGDFSRVPLNAEKKVAFTAVRGEAVLIENIGLQNSWIARPEWVEKEKVVSFASQPLQFHEEVLGVLGLFSRRTLTEVELGWLRTFADRAAAAIINARAFEEIAELRQRLEEERDYLRVEVKKASNFGAIIGESSALNEMMSQLALVADTDVTVLLNGESGTGKELAAVAIHEQSQRKDRTLVRVNCASIPRELFESEFFGHARGSFSGAVRDRTGRFDLAHQGTLFLDEVGEIPLDLQSKLLRVLQEGTFERVGDERTRRVDVRVVAATNRDLKAEVAAGRFREDLYYRLSVFPLLLPPLRERGEDIVALAQHFLNEAAQRMGRPNVFLTVPQAQALKGYSWPGNIRELQNMMERAVIIARGERIELEGLLPGYLRRGSMPSKGGEQIRPTEARKQISERRQVDSAPFVTEAEMKRNERSNLVAALKHAQGRVSGGGGAAELLGVKASTLASRMKKFEIAEREYEVN